MCVFQLPRFRNSSKMPVIVYFHSGGSSILHGPQYLMDKDIVLVTTNYRLGTLGELMQ